MIFWFDWHLLPDAVLRSIVFCNNKPFWQIVGLNFTMIWQESIRIFLFEDLWQDIIFINPPEMPIFDRLSKSGVF